MVAIAKVIAEKIKQLPEPNLLAEISRHISVAGVVEEGTLKALQEYVAQLPGQRGVFVDPKRLMGSLKCPECGERVNMGYFRVLACCIAGESLEIKRKIVMGYITLHFLETHATYPEQFWAQDEDLQDLVYAHEKAHPIDPLRDRRDPQEIKNLEKQVKRLSLEELNSLLDDMLGGDLWNRT